MEKSRILQLIVIVRRQSGKIVWFILKAGSVAASYSNRFFEAVKAREAVSTCDDGIGHQRDLDVLDTEINDLNNLISQRGAAAPDVQDSEGAAGRAVFAQIRQ